MTGRENTRPENSDPKQDEYTILIVDDEPAICRVLKEFLGLEGFETHAVSFAEEALEILDRTDVDLVITNIRMPGMDGLELTRLIKDRYSSHVIIMTGYHCYTIEEAGRIGADDLLHKPVTMADLVNSVNRVLKS